MMVALWICVGVVLGVLGTMAWLAWYFKDAMRG